MLDVTFELFNPTEKFVQSRLYISDTFLMFGRIYLEQGLYPPMISSYNKMQGGNNSFQNPLISKDSDCHEILFYAR